MFWNFLGFFFFSFAVLDVFLHISFRVSVLKRSAWDQKRAIATQGQKTESPDKQNKPLLEERCNSIRTISEVH